MAPLILVDLQVTMGEEIIFLELGIWGGIAWGRKWLSREEWSDEDTIEGTKKESNVNDSVGNGRHLKVKQS